MREARFFTLIQVAVAAAVLLPAGAAFAQVFPPSPTIPPSPPSFDTTSPSITAGPSVSSITSSSSIITWTTDEPSTSQVEFGTTISYGMSSSLDSTLVTSHSTSLAGLSPNTLYHYRVKSQDAAANLTVSADNTFTTPPPPDATPPVRSGGSPSGVLPAGSTSVTLSLTTDENATCQYTLVANSPYDPSLNNIFATTGGISHSQQITGLSSGSSYNYYVRCKDPAGNANPDDYTISFSIANPSPDTTAPTVPQGLSATAVSQTQITVNWSASTDPVVSGQVTSGVAGYRVYRCQGTCTPTVQIGSINAISYQDVNLTQNTTYTYVVAGYDNAGNESPKSVSVSRATLADTTPPQISNVQSSAITSTSARITWTTNELSDSVVSYGTSAGSLTQSISSSQMVTSHVINLSGLTRKKTYYYRVTSKDAANNTAFSATLSFKTSNQGGVNALQASNGSIRLSWGNIADSDIVSILIYRSTAGYIENPSGTPYATVSASQNQYHDAAVIAGTIYYYTVVTQDATGAFGNPQYISFTAKEYKGVSSPAQQGNSNTNLGISITSTLKQGARGDEVKMLQQALIIFGNLAEGNDTGYFGNLTEAAVKKYQCENYIVCGNGAGAGTVGPKTRASVNASVQASGHSAPPASANMDIISSLHAQIQDLQEKINKLK